MQVEPRALPGRPALYVQLERAPQAHRFDQQIHWRNGCAEGLDGVEPARHHERGPELGASERALCGELARRLDGPALRGHRVAKGDAQREVYEQPRRVRARLPVRARARGEEPAPPRVAAHRAGVHASKRDVVGGNEQRARALAVALGAARVAKRLGEPALGDLEGQLVETEALEGPLGGAHCGRA